MARVWHSLWLAGAAVRMMAASGQASGGAPGGVQVPGVVRSSCRLLPLTPCSSARATVISVQYYWPLRAP